MDSGGKDSDFFRILREKKNICAILGNAKNDTNDIIVAK